MSIDKELKEKIKQSQKESGFSIAGFSRREFAIMAVICQEVLLDEELLERVNPLSRFKGLDLELSALAEKLNDFLDV